MLFAIEDRPASGQTGEYLRKGTEVPCGIDYLWAVADSLNDQPRAIPGFGKPSEVGAGANACEAEIQLMAG